MYYKVLPGSQLYEDLKALQEKLNDAFQQTHDFVFKKLKATGINITQYQAGKYNDAAGTFYTRTHAGGVTSFMIDGEKPKGWKKSGEGYFPQNIKANKALIEEILALPVVDTEAIKKIIGFHTAWDDNSNKMCDYPGFRLSDEGHPHVICFHEWVVPKHYTPLPEMVEITLTEYRTICDRDK